MGHASARILAPAASVVIIGLLAGCAGGAGETESTMGTIRTAPPASTEPEIPIVEPVADEKCPYLSLGEASELNGEKSTEVKIDDRLEPPACFFYSAEGAVQLTTSVYELDSAERATEVVDEAAPADTSEQSEVEGGWVGGRSGGPGGALAALANGPRVLAVQSTQEESENVQRVAELVAPRLG